MRPWCAAYECAVCVLCVYHFIYRFAQRTHKCAPPPIHTRERASNPAALQLSQHSLSRDPRVAVSSLARVFSVALSAASLSRSMRARTCVHKQTCCYRSSPGVISLTHQAPIFIGEVIHEASSSSLPLLPLPRAHHALSRRIRERTSSFLFPSVLPTLELSVA